MKEKEWRTVSRLRGSASRPKGCVGDGTCFEVELSSSLNVERLLQVGGGNIKEAVGLDLFTRRMTS